MTNTWAIDRRVSNYCAVFEFVIAIGRGGEKQELHLRNAAPVRSSRGLECWSPAVGAVRPFRARTVIGEFARNWDRRNGTLQLIQACYARLRSDVVT